MGSKGVLPDFIWISQDTNVGFCCLLCHHLLLLSAKNEPKICVHSRVTCKLAIIAPRPVVIKLGYQTTHFWNYLHQVSFSTFCDLIGEINLHFFSFLWMSDCFTIPTFWHLVLWKWSWWTLVKMSSWQQNDTTEHNHFDIYIGRVCNKAVDGHCVKLVYISYTLYHPMLVKKWIQNVLYVEARSKLYLIYVYDL